MKRTSLGWSLKTTNSEYKRYGYSTRTRLVCLLSRFCSTRDEFYAHLSIMVRNPNFSRKESI